MRYAGVEAISKSRCAASVRWISSALVALGLTFWAAPAAAQTVQLFYSLKPGQLLRYQCNVTGQGTTEAAGRRDPITMRAQFVYEMQVLHIQGDRATVQCRTTDTMIGATYAGQPLPVAVNIPTITVVMDKFGHIISSQVQAAPQSPASPLAGLLGGQLMGGGSAGSLDVSQLYGQLHLPGFPQRPVRVGEVWQQQAQVMTASGQPIALAWRTRLIGMEDFDGRRCAKLRTAYSFPLDLLLSAMLRDILALQGNVQGTSTMYFDLDARVPVAFDSVQQTQMKMSAAMLTGEQVSASMVMRTQLRARLIAGRERQEGGTLLNP